ncbi:uncharacterized protein [Montipora capricornis]|uniref:uncharacterized protein isoform X1 n=1 Tax=Montipora capricornis TaxID=246305 RepID=UPI0035F1213A
MDFSRGKEMFNLVLLTFCLTAHVSHCCTVGPLGFVKSQSAKIECDLTGSVSKVMWYKDKKSLENGTDGLYQSIVQLMDGTTRSILHFPVVKMAHEAIYRCKANSNKSTICPNGKRFSVIVVCGKGHVTALSKKYFADKFSEAKLKCSALSWRNCLFGPVKLTWHYGNKTLQNSTKYTIKQHKKKECQRRLLDADSTLEISNVTIADAGQYYCQLSCGFVAKTDKDFIKLVIVPPTGSM